MNLCHVWGGLGTGSKGNECQWAFYLILSIYGLDLGELGDINDDHSGQKKNIIIIIMIMII